jgi:hypothetical protein
MDIMNGTHLCGECVGEVLKDHDNLLISEQFATAIAETVRDSHLHTSKQIFADKYEISTEIHL